MKRIGAFFLLLYAGLWCLQQAPNSLAAGWLPLAQSAGGAVVVCGSGWTGPTSGLTHCWPMDNAHVTGTTITDAIGSDNGTAGANVTASTGPSGLTNSARLFDGSTAAIALATQPLPSAPYTLAFWLNKNNNTSNDAADQRWVCIGDVGTVVANGSNNGSINTQASGGNDSTTVSGAVGSAAWHHIALTWDGATKIIYLDGSSIASAGGGLGNGCDAGVYGIGERNSTARLWAGSMAVVVVYSSALSAGNITTLFNAF